MRLTVSPARGDGTAAQQLAPPAGRVTGGRLPPRQRARDGSTAGPDGAPVVLRRTPIRLLWRPDALGPAQVYIAGERAVPATPRDRYVEGGRR
ncbi:hypothetical protein [Streptomyces sp. NPDC002889]|uniref:hypothetical protein n=1 Tax=Streptomyces sp. NPDC002889 TaxID=3364669 RepID=UPI0036C5D819